MKWRRNFLSDILLFTIILFLGYISFLSYQQITKLDSDANWVTHSDIVKFKLEQALSNIEESETDQRGFLLTDDTSFLAPLQMAEKMTYESILTIDSLTLDNKEQQDNTAGLKKLVALRFQSLHEILGMSHEPAASLIPFLLAGRQIMDQIKLKIGDMQAIEDILLKKRIKAKEHAASITPFYSLLFSICAISIIALAYYRLRNETRLRFEAQDSESKIHTFFNEVPAMLAIIKGPEHSFEFANPSYREMIGNQNPVGKTVRDVFAESEGQNYAQLLDRVFQTKVTYTGWEMPVSLFSETGKPKLVFLNCIFQAFLNRAGDTEGILIFCYDVSEMVLTRKKIEEVEHRSRLAIEAADLGTFDWDLKNQQFISSPKLIDIFGFKNSIQVSHQNLIDCFHPADKGIRDKAVADSYSKGSLVYEARIIRPDQSIRWITVYGKIIYNEKKEAERMYGTVMDITQQKNILEDLKESEARFRLLADSMPQLIWTSDKGGDLNYFNQAMYNFSGQPFEYIKKEGWINIVHPEERTESQKRWKYSIESGNEFIFEHRFRDRKGDYHWQLSRALPFRDSKGQIQLWVGTSTDIQEQKNFMLELEEKVKERTQSLLQTNIHLEKTILELERSNSELESFNYIASHDLQEPLRKIIAFSQRIGEKEKDRLSDFSKDYFTRLISATTRMQNLIDAFLAYSKTNTKFIVFEQTDLNQIMMEVQNDLHDLIEEKDASIQSGDLPVVKVVPLQFTQLFVNLIGNSLKYSKSDTKPVIRVSAILVSGKEVNMEGASSSSQYWKISIEDNGIGFEQQYENKIFELFQRLHGKLDYIGTGIGLAICKKIMYNHNGFISATGYSGVGAVFNVFLPVSD
jgi:PAS domain S-box-containing protein